MIKLIQKAIASVALAALALPSWAFDLRESTASQEWCFVLTDISDGTPLTGATIANTEIKLVLPGGTTETNKNSGGATEIGATGRYCATFDATDTATTGSMTVVIRDGAATSVEKEYNIDILDTLAYDVKYGTDVQQVHVVEYTAGVIDATAIATDAIGAAEIATDAIGAAEIAADAIGASEIATDAITAAEIAADAVGASEAGFLLDSTGFNGADVGSGTGLTAIATGTAQAATATTLQLASAETFADDELIGALIHVTGGTTGVGQTNCITDYTGSTDTATVDTWVTTPTGTITYEVIPNVGQTCPVSLTGGATTIQADASGYVKISDGTGTGQVSLTSGVVDSVTTVTTLTGHTAQTGDSFARLGAPAGASVSADIAAIEAQTDDIGVAGAGLTAIDLPNQTMDITGNITGNLSGSVGSVTGAVGSVTGAVGSVTADVTVADTSFEDEAALQNMERWGAILCTVETATSAVAIGCDLTTPRGAAVVTAQDDDYIGRTIVVYSSSAVPPALGEDAIITDSTWDGVNSALDLTLTTKSASARGLSAVPAVGDVLVIQPN